MRRHHLVILTAFAFAAPGRASDAPADSSMVLKGSEEGTTFKSLTIEAENRVQIDFERPRLNIDLDPASAPGLSWGSAHDVLNRSLPDFATPFVRDGRVPGSPYVARPWLATFRTGELARITPQLEGVDRWTLGIADSKGRSVRKYEGNGKPPKSLGWDGLDDAGHPCSPGLTYSFVLNAYDRAGNERNFVGDSFTLPPYRVGEVGEPVLLIAGEDLPGPSVSGNDAVTLEIASHFNQCSDPLRPVLVRVHARSFDQAQTIGNSLGKRLAPWLIGPEGRIVVEADVDDSAPRSGSVELRLGAAR